MPFSGAGGSTFLGLWDDIEHPGLELEVGRRGGGEKPPVPELWLSLNLAVKEQNERVYKCGRECNFFCRQCESFLP